MLPQALYDVLKDRRSVSLRALLPDPIASAYLELMLEAAHWAPAMDTLNPGGSGFFIGATRHSLGEAFAEAYRLGDPS
jgi:hypothetical protein